MFHIIPVATFVPRNEIIKNNNFTSQVNFRNMTLCYNLIL